MTFGICAGLLEAQAALEAGFDYVEVAASGFQGTTDHWQPEAYKGLPILSTNVFFDTSIRLFGPERTPYLEYCQRTIDRAAELGVEIMVIGGSGNRRAPNNEDCDQAFVEVCTEIQALANPYGIQIAPEPLNRSETNTGNDQRKLAELLRKHGMGYTADTYHVLYEWNADGSRNPLEELWEEKMPHAPVHVHLSDISRNAPKADDPMLLAFVRRLRALSYDGAISLECRRPKGFDLATVLKQTKRLFESA